MLAQKLKDLRTANKMTQQEMAHKLRISRSTLAGYEAENKQPSYDVLIKIAQLFNVPTDYLLESGIFGKKAFHLVTLFRENILSTLLNAELITRKMYKQLKLCSTDSYVMFISNLITDVTGNEKEIQYSYLPNIGLVGKEMYETLSIDQKEDFKYHTFHESLLRPDQYEIIDKISDLSAEQQEKIVNYINMSYEIEIEKTSSVAADENNEVNPGKSYPSSGTEGK